MRTRLAAALVAALMGSAIGTAFAHTPSDPEAVGNIAKLSTAANLIFQGKVVAVKYRNSPARGDGSGSVPYTFVTYAISEVLQGSSPGSRITLRFIGGADGRGGFVEAEGVPQFQVGDEDILFVVGNGETGCPLVMCEFGRFRILNKAVHEAHGSPVVSVENGRIRTEGKAPAAFETFRYPAPDFDELMKRREFAESVRRSGMTPAQARSWYEAEAPEFVELRAAEVETAGAAARRGPARAAVSVGPFVSAIQIVAAASERRSRPVIRSIDPNAPIASPAAVASAPPPLPYEPAEKLSPGRIIRKR